MAREPAVPNADTAHTPLMIPAVTPEMILGAGPRRVPRSGGDHAPSGPRSPMARPNLGGAPAVAAPVTDPGTGDPGPVPAQAGPRFESAVPDWPDPEDTALAEPGSEPAQTPVPAKSAEGASRKHHGSGPRDLLDPVVRNAKGVKHRLRRKRSSQ
ncbi:hypothetical protein AVL48_20320 [Amycolatopsis regifaucium]|uniref:Uncharacterized protein n=2 Tax=Amycolatopsis regifaucium TaxID=546365 RepID=A0A154MXX1_9PSEU|nr:hypothetical protein AVL48_20320 [Amycolatopsis regifaucium]OKA11411.1 hypothetical protein ATP06_0200710 [Amycolatopsis regifaucium]